MGWKLVMLNEMGVGPFMVTILAKDLSEVAKWVLSPEGLPLCIGKD